MVNSIVAQISKQDKDTKKKKILNNTVLISFREGIQSDSNVCMGNSAILKINCSRDIWS